MLLRHSFLNWRVARGVIDGQRLLLHSPARTLGEGWASEARALVAAASVHGSFRRVSDELNATPTARWHRAPHKELSSVTVVHGGEGDTVVWCPGVELVPRVRAGG